MTTTSKSQDDELREQIDAFILKFEGIDAEDDTLDCIMSLISQKIIEAEASVYGQWRNSLEGRIKQAKSFNEPTSALENDLKMVQRILATLTQGIKE